MTQLLVSRYDHYAFFQPGSAADHQWSTEGTQRAYSPSIERGNVHQGNHGNYGNNGNVGGYSRYENSGQNGNDVQAMVGWGTGGAGGLGNYGNYGNNGNSGGFSTYVNSGHNGNSIGAYIRF